MSDVFRQTYLHIIWGTYLRKRLLEPDVEAFVHPRLESICSNLGLRLIAANSAWDHTHCLIEWNCRVTYSDAVREMKSRTALEWNRLVQESGQENRLKWQREYGIVSIRKSDVPTVVDYIRNQKTRHRQNNTWRPFEQRSGENED